MDNIEQVRALAYQIRNAFDQGENTAERVGRTLIGILDNLNVGDLDLETARRNFIRKDKDDSTPYILTALDFITSGGYSVERFLKHVSYITNDKGEDTQIVLDLGLSNLQNLNALGIGSWDGPGGGEGLIKKVYDYNDLNNIFNNANLTDTFNAYTIATKFKEHDLKLAGLSGNYVTVDTAQAITGQKNFTLNPTVNSNQILHAGNYNSYAPTLTGGRASGTWNINVNGYSKSLIVLDIRNTDKKPNELTGNSLSSWFNNTGTPDTFWWSGITVTGWTNSYISWQLIGPSATANQAQSLYYRTGVGSKWESWRTILDSNNYTSLIDSRYVKKAGDTMTGSLINHNYITVTHPSNSFYGAIIRNGTGNSYNSLSFESRSVDGISDPGYGFHKTGVYAGCLIMPADGTFRFTNINGTASANLIVGTLSASNWFKSIGATGWVNDTYGGGIHMTDSDYVRVYNGKKFYVSNTTSSPNTNAAISTSGGMYAAGNIIAAGAITALSSSSDMRLKNNPSDFDALSILNDLYIFSYKWNDTAKALSKWYRNDYLHYGMSAQEIAEKYPFMSRDFIGGYKAIDYAMFVPILGKGIQEVDNKVALLEQRVEYLEKRLLQYEKSA